MLESVTREDHAALIAQGASQAPAASMRGILRRLFDELHARRIIYCHWKSNIRLADALTGDDDVDLLIDRTQAAAFHEALLRQGFKRVRSRGGLDHPGVFHAIALDEDRLELVHVHAYFQIVSGDSLVKSYRFDVESALLADTRFLHGVRVPSAEAELVMFALRNALKHVHLVEILMARRDAKKSAQEMAWLYSCAEPEKVEQLWADLFPELPEDLLPQIVRVFSDKRASLASRVILGHKVARRLRGRRRCSVLTTTLSRAYRIVTMLLARFSNRRDFVPESGGMIVALVGPKATGKSTLSAELAKRLGACLDVVHVHAGKPPATALTFLPRLLIPLARRMFPRERPDAYEKQDRNSRRSYSLLYCLRMMMLAHDRKILLRRALRLSTAGSLVISDRYPSNATGAIDSSCFDDTALRTAGSRFKRWMMLQERAAYKTMPNPGFVIRLSAPMETAVARDAIRIKGGGPDEDAVRRRWDMETAGAFASAVMEVRTDRPLAETIAAVVKAAWSKI